MNLVSKNECWHVKTTTSKIQFQVWPIPPSVATLTVVVSQRLYLLLLASLWESKELIVVRFWLATLGKQRWLFQCRNYFADLSFTMFPKTAFCKLLPIPSSCFALGYFLCMSPITNHLLSVFAFVIRPSPSPHKNFSLTSGSACVLLWILGWQHLSCSAYIPSWLRRRTGKIIIIIVF